MVNLKEHKLCARMIHHLHTLIDLKCKTADAQNFVHTCEGKSRPGVARTVEFYQALLHCTGNWKVPNYDASLLCTLYAIGKPLRIPISPLTR